MKKRAIGVGIILGVALVVGISILGGIIWTILVVVTLPGRTAVGRSAG